MVPSLTQTLINKGHELQEEYAGLLEQRAANRRSLRDLATQGLLTEDENVTVLELYPPRERTEADDQQGE